MRKQMNNMVRSSVLQKMLPFHPKINIRSARVVLIFLVLSIYLLSIYINRFKSFNILFDFSWGWLVMN